MKEELASTLEQNLTIEQKIKLARKPLPQIRIFNPIFRAAGNPVGLRPERLVSEDE